MLHTKNGDQDVHSPTSEGEFQYQRAYALSRDLREQLARYSVEQFKQIESQNVLVYVGSLISILRRAYRIRLQKPSLSHSSQDYRDRLLLLCARPV